MRTETVNLSAARDVSLESAQDYSSLDSRSRGSNASIGIGVGIGGDQNGFTLELAASQNKAKANGESVTHQNSHVVGTDKVSVTSGRDTNLKGAQLIGDTIEGTVGRDLNIESRQDTETYHSRETALGMQASVCVPPFCYGTTVHASGSVTQGNTDSTYRSVQEQSGIYAGQGGFDVNVRGNTDLKGGILASTAEAGKNSLTTGTLTTSDIENKAEYSSGTSTIAASYSGGKSVPADKPKEGPPVDAHVQWAGNTNLLQGAANSLAARAAGNAQKSIDGSAAGVTKSAIASGAVVITDDAGQQAKTGKSAEDAIAALDRDTANANQSIDKIFDAQKVKDQQELDRVKSEVAQQAAPLIYDAVGTLTEDLPVQGKVTAHAIIGGLIADAMGGKFVAGAAGDAAATAAAELVGRQILTSPDLQDMSEQDRKALVQIAGTIIAAGAGKAVGGSTQDAAASGVAGGLGTQYNWGMHLPVPGPQVPPTPADPQKSNSPPGKPAYDGDEGVLTGTPDQSKQHTWEPMFQPIADGVDRIRDAGNTVAAVAGTILPNPMELVEGLGAIVSSKAGKSPSLDVVAPNGSLVGSPIGRHGTPREMPGSSNPNQSAEDFAKQAFGGQIPVKITPIKEGGWNAALPDGTYVTYRPAGQASRTAPDTASVDINGPAVNAQNAGLPLKLKFPPKL